MTAQTEISMSSLKEFPDCPLRYRFHHIESAKPAWQEPRILKHYRRWRENREARVL